MKNKSREPRKITQFFQLFGIAKMSFIVLPAQFSQYFSRALNSITGTSSFSQCIKNPDNIRYLPLQTYFRLSRRSVRIFFTFSICKIFFKLQFFLSNCSAKYLLYRDQKTRSYHNHPILLALSLHAQSK